MVQSALSHHGQCVTSSGDIWVMQVHLRGCCALLQLLHGWMVLVMMGRSMDVHASGVVTSIFTLHLDYEIAGADSAGCMSFLWSQG